MPKKISKTDERYLKAREMYINGYSVRECSRQVGIDYRVITRYLKEDKDVNYSPSNAKIDLNSKKYKLAKKTYLETKSIEQTAKIVKISRKILSKLLKEDGIDVVNYQNISRVDEDVFETIDTEEKAYWLGFLYADGNVSKSRIECSLKYSDKEHLEKFKQFLNYKGNIMEKNIYSKVTKKYYKACRICFGCSKMAQDLINKGCVEQKSLILKFPTEEQVPQRLIRHFIRGYFDGDGSLGKRKMARKELFTPEFSFLGTENMLVNIYKAMGWKKASLVKDKRRSELIYNISWSGSEYFSYLDDIYKDSSIYLDRKYQIYKELKNIENEVISYMKIFHKFCGTRGNRDGKRVIMLDGNNKEIKSFRSKVEVKSFLGIAGHLQLNEAIKNGTMYKGYYWKED